MFSLWSERWNPARSTLESKLHAIAESECEWRRTKIDKNYLIKVLCRMVTGLWALFCLLLTGDRAEEARRERYVYNFIHIPKKLASSWYLFFMFLLLNARSALCRQDVKWWTVHVIPDLGWTHRFTAHINSILLFLIKHNAKRCWISVSDGCFDKHPRVSFRSILLCSIIEQTTELNAYNVKG